MKAKSKWYARCVTVAATAAALGVLSVPPLTFAQSSNGDAMNNATQMMGSQQGSNEASSDQPSGQGNDTGNYGYGPGMMRGYGYGPGMMRGYGYGPGSMYGYGPEMWGRGYGPGMHGYGYGPNMMRGYGCGPGTMHGYGPGMWGHGYGPGMRGYGYGPGMMWGGWHGWQAWGALDLTPDQQQKIEQLQQAQDEKLQALYAQLYQEMGQLHGLMATEQPDPEAVGKAFDQVSATRKKLMLAHLKLRSGIDQVLTSKQRKILKDRYQRWQGDFDQQGDY